MPIYEYLCEECGAGYEKLVRSKSEKVSCPKCGSGRKTLQLSTFSAHSGNSAANGRGAALRQRSAGSGQASSAGTSDFTCTGNPSACGCNFKN